MISSRSNRPDVSILYRSGRDTPSGRYLYLWFVGRSGLSNSLPSNFRKKAFDDARAEGVFPVVREGFRTHDEQTKIFDDKVKAFMKEGHRRKKAEELAEKWVAVPGSSEHELGLAVDINADKERSTNEEVYSWLAENAWRYGFILRYPYGSESITGIDYEPWHYRYVGKDAAAIIYETGVTLEEYDKSLQL